MIHTPVGFDRPGETRIAKGDTGRLSVTVLDHATGKPTFCRVCIVGPDGNYYEPNDHLLSPWSLDRSGNRKGKGPIRYYGWFFYSSGQFEVTVPAPGPVRVEVWKGFEYRPEIATTFFKSGQSQQVEVRLHRAAAMTDHGYWSGDTHLHMDRKNETDDQRILDLLAAEDIRFGSVLSMNNPVTNYSGRMDRQDWQQLRGFGSASIVRRGPYHIASGQEYRSDEFGHICLLMHRQLVLGGMTVDTNQWPVFGLVGEETRRLDGYSFHAHGGYSKEILADFAQRTTDGVELLQFAKYRGISLDGWYRILNVGFQFPAVGASDFPYCRAFGDCRTYVLSNKEPNFAEWVRGAAVGQSFFTTGPLILLEVNGQRPGDRSDLKGAGPHRVAVNVRVRSEITPVTNIELLVNGRPVTQRKVENKKQQGDWIELKQSVTLNEPSWIAARAYSVASSGSPDAEAHTNPVYFTIDGVAPYNPSDLQWLLDQLDDRIAHHQDRKLEMREQVLNYFRESRKRLLTIQESGGQRIDDKKPLKGRFHE